MFLASILYLKFSVLEAEIAEQLKDRQRLASELKTRSGNRITCLFTLRSRLNLTKLDTSYQP